MAELEFIRIDRNNIEFVEFIGIDRNNIEFVEFCNLSVWIFKLQSLTQQTGGCIVTLTTVPLLSTIDVFLSMDF